jgi:carbamoyltransferase
MSRSIGVAAGRRTAARDVVLIGVSGARRNPAAAAAVNGRLVAVCEQERLTRIRGAARRPDDLPNEAVAAVLKMAGAGADAVRAYVTAEEGMRIPSGLPSLRLDHHHSHAATAFLTSSFRAAAVLICDRHSNPAVSVWRGDQVNLVNQQWPWRGDGFAAVYSECCELFGFAGQEHRFEALARLDPGDRWESLTPLFRFDGETLCVQANWKQSILDWLNAHGTAWSLEHAAGVAAAFQRALGDALIGLVDAVRRAVDVPVLCLGGGLFYNTYFNTLVSQSGRFEHVFVPPNPGNPGIAAGAALAASPSAEPREAGSAVSAFLGPEFDSESIKRTLDNCKLSAEFLRTNDVIELCVKELLAGRLVAWFHGRMEWGHRALGNRSILASPFSPYVLDNLNVFLKQRERHRAYGLSVCEEQRAQYFDGPAQSRWMEYDYRFIDCDRFRHVIPDGASTVRVQTIGPEPCLFRDLHYALAAAGAPPVLVNTSFNGFSEPIVNSPRDAIRVFYGTGIDTMVLGRFVLRK